MTCLFQFVKGINKFADDAETRKRTVIFNSKLCNNVELEVGNFVRIHPPWYEFTLITTVSFFNESWILIDKNEYII